MTTVKMFRHVSQFFILGWLFLPGIGFANGCIDCRKDPIFRTQNPKLFRYFRDWQGSTHYKAGVTCDDCHGGDSDARAREMAHDEGFLPSNPHSKIHYKNLSETCGRCHQKIYGNFIQSLHYKALINDESAPHCATCHGAINSKAYFTSIVNSTCKTCHDPNNSEMPQILEESEQVLKRMNIIKGYLGWASIFCEYQEKPERADVLKRRFMRLSDDWHRFSLDTSNRDSIELLAALKQVYEQAKEEMASPDFSPGGR